jgi:hypothetical protein
MHKQIHGFHANINICPNDTHIRITYVHACIMTWMSGTYIHTNKHAHIHVIRVRFPSHFPIAYNVIAHTQTMFHLSTCMNPWNEEKRGETVENTSYCAKTYFWGGGGQGGKQAQIEIGIRS